MGLIQVGKYFMINCSWYAGKLGTRARLFMEMMPVAGAIRFTGVDGLGSG